MLSLTIDGKDFDISDFADGYLECALWSSCNDDEFLDEDFGIIDFKVEALTELLEDCDAFLKDSKHLWGDEILDSQAGHDFWLDRNGHGCGFQDRGLKHGDALYKAAKVYGGVDLLADKGKVYAL